MNKKNYKYEHDAQGNRTRKVVEKGYITETRYYIGNYEIFRKETSGVIDYERKTLNINDDEKVFVRIEQKTDENEVVRYQYDNHLGSACLELDTAGQIISYEEYHPFGTTSYRSGRSETEVSLKRYKYNGKERDEETGLYYYGMRYYAAWLCRFVSVDPLQFEYSELTPFQYASNSPVTMIDLDGKEGVKAISGLGKLTRKIYDFYQSKKTIYSDGQKGRIYSMGSDGKLSLKQTGTDAKNVYYINKEGRQVLFGDANLERSYDDKIFNAIIADMVAKTSLEKKAKTTGYNPNYKKDGVGAVAYSNTKSKSIYLITNRNFSSNYYNLLSTFRHENLHLQLDDKPTLKEHAFVYMYQMGFPEFEHTSDDFKISIAAGAAAYLFKAHIEDKLSVEALEDHVNYFNSEVGKQYGISLKIDSNMIGIGVLKNGKEVNFQRYNPNIE